LQKPQRWGTRPDLKINNSILFQQNVDGIHDFRRLPILSPDDLAHEASLAIDQVSLRDHHRSIHCLDLFGGIAIGGKIDVIILNKFLVGVGVFVFADSDNDSALLSNVLLETVQRFRLLKARGTPRRPKIQYYDLAAQVRQMRRAGNLHIKVGGLPAREARLALAITWESKREQNSGGKDQADRSKNLVFQWFFSNTYIILARPGNARDDLWDSHSWLSLAVLVKLYTIASWRPRLLQQRTAKSGCPTQMNPNPTVSAIVPARNEEATIAAAVESLAAQPEIKEIFVINDQSTDRTAAVLQELSGRIQQLRILETKDLPAGWVGKNHAVSLGAAQATGDWLLFTDADGVHMPGSTAHALADTEGAGAGLVSYSPEQETRTWWERALIPFVYTRLAHKYSYAAVNHPDSPAAAASGQYLLIRRKDYNRIGGHAAVAAEVLEDVALARLAKQAGIVLHFAPGYGIIRVRMYRTFPAMWQGWSKNLYPLMGGTPRDVGRELFRVVPWIPLLLLPLVLLHLIWGVLGIAMLAGRHAAYAADLRRNRFPAALAIYYLPGLALYVAALLNSESRYARGKVIWKGREYRVGSGRET
jgi:hypothetical protein